MVITAPFAFFVARLTSHGTFLIATLVMTADAQTRLAARFVALVVPRAVEPTGMAADQEMFAPVGCVLRAHKSACRRHRQDVRCRLLALVARQLASLAATFRRSSTGCGALMFRGVCAAAESGRMLAVR